MKRRLLVVAPHPDDEVLGVGGTLARAAAEGDETFVLIVTRGFPPRFVVSDTERVQEEARRAHALLGVQETFTLAFPAAELNSTPHADLNAEIARIIDEVRPERLFVPFTGDLHLDHQRVFASSLVAARPSSAWSPKATYAYETLSETNWNAPYISPSFQPNVFVDVSAYLETKIRAMQAYTSQVRPSPHERSVEALRALATLRGSTVGVAAAEALVLVRQTM